MDSMTLETMQGSLMLSMVSLKAWRSSALPDGLRVGALELDAQAIKMPSAASSMPRLRPVCPPRVAGRCPAVPSR